MIRFTQEFFEYSTAEVQDNRFTGDVYIPRRDQIGVFVEYPTGDYRIMDGKLYRISEDQPCFDDLSE